MADGIPDRTEDNFLKSHAIRASMVLSQIKAGLRASDIVEGVRLDPLDYVRLVALALEAAESAEQKHPK